MTCCLVHNPRYRSLFHAVINELRREDCMPIAVLRGMPSRCCTCKCFGTLPSIDANHDKTNLETLMKLRHEINREQNIDPNLTLSLRLLEVAIYENRNLQSKSQSASVVEKHNNVSSNSNNKSTGKTVGSSMTRSKVGKRRIAHSPQPFKSGKFFFLPYNFKNTRGVSTRNLFRRRTQHRRFTHEISKLETKYQVLINMITQKTTDKVKKTLQCTKEGKGNVTIYNKGELVSGQDGEWVFVRQKPNTDKTVTIDFTNLYQELKHNWQASLRQRNAKE